VEQVSIGNEHFCIVAEYEGLKCWLSMNNGDNYLEMDVPEEFWMGTKYISTGEAHSCAYNITDVNHELKYILKCFGDNAHGQSNIPRVVQHALETGVAEVTSLVSGPHNNCVVLNQSNDLLLMLENKIICWGKEE